MEPVRIGVVGVGNISGIYLKNLAAFDGTEVVAVADLDQNRAQAVAQERGIGKALSVEALLADPEVELVLNLTIPGAHGPVALDALQAGKHVYNEKPLSTDRNVARQVVDLAASKGLKVGCAPDTFLGSGLQTARKAIDDGLIGEVIGARGFFLARGPEPWHPNPEFFYKPGGGPMLDMGPYYITALVHLIGGIRRVSGSARASYTQRPIPLTNEGFYSRADQAQYREQGYQIEVETPTHFAAVFDFDNGAIGDFSTSFDVYHVWSQQPITIYGSEGTMRVPDPNTFGGDVDVIRHDESEWRTLDPIHAFRDNSRGLGVLDMARAIRQGGDFRASGALAYHVLDTMLAVEESSNQNRHILLDSNVSRPAALGATEYRDPAA